jgi:signal transduction histidine kinase
MRLGGLTTRIAVGGAVVAAVFIVQLIVSFDSLHTIEHDTKREQHASQAVVAAIRIEKLVLDLETGERGYVVSGDPRFLQPWRQARRALPQQSRLLTSLVPGPTSASIVRAWQAYLRDWSIPVVQLARRSRAAAQARVATRGGLRRVDAIRTRVDSLVARENAVADAARAKTNHADRTGTWTAVIGAVVRIVVFFGILAWLLYALVWPLRRLVGATAAVARGQQGVQVDEVGAGEVGDLARSFNEMSRSLERNRRTLESQNLDLERLANVLRAVLDSTIDGILLSDAEGNVQLANRPVVTLARELGMDLGGTVIDNLLSVAHRVKDEDTYRAAMARLRTNSDEETFDEFEDSVSGRVFQGFTSPVRDDRGGFLGRVWTLREVTQQRELDRLKDDFVATVSHELRTPLTSMMGFLEMIREEEAGHLTEEQKRFLSIVYRSSERLQRLVGDLLFVARLDASGLQLHFDEVQIDGVLAECVESSAALARSREIELHSEHGDVPPVWADRERLAQLVANLVSNAIKFTPAGGRVSTRAFVEDGNAVIEVEDTGIGIPEAEQERLFQRFFRSSTATQQAIPGTGLGLVISQAIAEAHGGRIDVRSTAGEGTCFTVTIPLLRDELAA